MTGNSRIEESKILSYVRFMILVATTQTALMKNGISMKWKFQNNLLRDCNEKKNA